MIRIDVLGPLDVTVGGCRLKIPKKAGALLAYLALQPGTAMTRDKLADLLGPYQDAEGSRHSLRNCLLELRKALGPAAAALDCGFHEIRLAGAHSDAARFAALADSHLLADLDAAASLFRAELLDGLAIASESWEEWLAAERRRLHDIAAKVFFRLSRAAGAAGPAGRHDDAMAAARRVLGLEPYLESAHRRLMNALVAADRRGDAVLYYRECAKALRRELGIGPGAKTRNLLQHILAAGIPGADAPKLAAPNYAAIEGQTAAAANALLRAALAAEIARNGELTRALEKLRGILRELTKPPPRNPMDDGAAAYPLLPLWELAA